MRATIAALENSRMQSRTAPKCHRIARPESRGPQAGSPQEAGRARAAAVFGGPASPRRTGLVVPGTPARARS